MSEVERIAAEDFVHRSYAERLENDIARLRTENQIRAQEYAALLGLWKETQERLEKAERVIAAVRPVAAEHEPITTRNAKEYCDSCKVVLALAQYDNIQHGESK